MVGGPCITFATVLDTGTVDNDSICGTTWTFSSFTKGADAGAGTNVAGLVVGDSISCFGGATVGPETSITGAGAARMAVTSLTSLSFEAMSRVMRVAWSTLPL